MTLYKQKHRESKVFLIDRVLELMHSSYLSKIKIPQIKQRFSLEATLPPDNRSTLQKRQSKGYQDYKEIK